jgi:thiol-disulfide isomerase/thioredoxin
MLRQLRKRWLDILLLLFIAFLLIPGVSLPFKAFLQRLLLAEPDVQLVQNKALTSYGWTLTKLDGTRTDLSQSKGKIVFLNFWATWCPPCLAELPSIERLYADYGAQVDFYLVSSEDAEALIRFAEKRSGPLPIYLSGQIPPAALEYTALPTTFLIDKEGRVLLREEGAARWDRPEFSKLLDSLIVHSR